MGRYPSPEKEGIGKILGLKAFGSSNLSLPTKVTLTKDNIAFIS